MIAVSFNSKLESLALLVIWAAVCAATKTLHRNMLIQSFTLAHTSKMELK